MKILIPGGTGFIGQYLVAYFLKQGHDIAVLSRSRKKIMQRFGNKVLAIQWQDLDKSKIDDLKKFNIIINLTGAGIADKKWSPKRKQEIIQSRIETTKKLVHLCSMLGAQSPDIFCASAVGVYGLQKFDCTSLPPALTEDENTDLHFANDFSSQITRLWEEETKPAINQGIRVVNTRFGVVLGKHGGALKRMIPPFQLFIGGKIGSGCQPFSWVSIVDLARAIEFLFQKKEISGPVNIVSPNCINQAQLAKAIGKVLQKPSFMPTPGFLLKLVFGEMAEELLLNGQHVYPKKLLNAGFEFTYPNIIDALEYSLKNDK